MTEPPLLGLSQWVSWGENITILRKRLGLSQAECAARVGCSQPQWSRWEKGNGCPTDRSKLRIAAVLDVNADRLFPLTQSGPDQFNEEAVG